MHGHVLAAGPVGHCDSQRAFRSDKLLAIRSAKRSESCSKTHAETEVKATEWS